MGRRGVCQDSGAVLRIMGSGGTDDSTPEAALLTFSVFHYCAKMLLIPLACYCYNQAD